jgi:hypothetical protein
MKKESSIPCGGSRKTGLKGYQQKSKNLLTPELVFTDKNIL